MCTFHQSACCATKSMVLGPAPPMTRGIFLDGRQEPDRAPVELKELPVVVDRLPAPQRLHDLDRFGQPLRDVELRCWPRRDRARVAPEPHPIPSSKRPAKSDPGRPPLGPNRAGWRNGSDKTSHLEP